jgi:hypothetical protein
MHGVLYSALHHEITAHCISASKILLNNYNEKLRAWNETQSVAQDQ